VPDGRRGGSAWRGLAGPRGREKVSGTVFSSGIETGGPRFGLWGEVAYRVGVEVGRHGADGDGPGGMGGLYRRGQIGSGWRLTAFSHDPNIFHTCDPWGRAGPGLVGGLAL